MQTTGMLHSRLPAALAAQGETAARQRAAPAARLSLQQQLAAQARCRFSASSSSSPFLAGGARLQAAVEAAASGLGSRAGPARCVGTCGKVRDSRSWGLWCRSRSWQAWEASRPQSFPATPPMHA